MSAIANKISDSIWGADFLRSNSYDDKPRSKTRLVLTLILLIGIIVCFIVLIIYKVNNLSIVVNTITPNGKSKTVDFKDFHKHENDSTLTCVSTKKAYYYSFIKPTNTSQTIDDLYDVAGADCISQYPSSDFATKVFGIGCDNGAFGAYTIIEDDGVIAGALLSRDDLSDAEFDALYDLATDQYLIDYSAWLLSMDNLQQLVNENYISPAQDITPYVTLINNLVNSDNYSDAVNQGAINNILNHTYIDYEAYFAEAQVVSCQYYSEQGPFDVFQYASTLTSTIFAWTVIVFGILLSLIKVIQHASKKHNEPKEGGIDMEAKVETKVEPKIEV